MKKKSPPKKAAKKKLATKPTPYGKKHKPRGKKQIPDDADPDDIRNWVDDDTFDPPGEWMG